MALKIDIYISEICASYHQLRENLDRTLTELNLQVAATYHTIYYEDAISRNIKGSPSVWINGRDAFASPNAPGLT